MGLDTASFLNLVLRRGVGVVDLAGGGFVGVEVGDSLEGSVRARLVSWVALASAWADAGVSVDTGVPADAGAWAFAEAGMLTDAGALADAGARAFARARGSAAPIRVPHMLRGVGE